MEFVIMGLVVALLISGCFYFYHISQLKSEIRLKDASIGGLEESIASERTNTAVLNQQLNTCNDQLRKAQDEMASLQGQLSTLMETINEQKVQLKVAEEQVRASKEAIEGLESARKRLEQELNQAKLEKVEFEVKFNRNEESLRQLRNEYELKLREKEQDQLKLQSENKELSNKLTQLEEQEPIRNEQYRKNLEILTLTMKQHQEEEERKKKKLEELAVLEAQRLKETWLRHEKEVEDKMKLMCQQLAIEYIDKENFPFGGKPDNSIKICDEFIVFDSKSPQGEDLSNFPNYIKAQAESAKKYLKNSEVKKEIFFVVPLNAISVVKETCINLGTYVVHVITTDALRPVLSQLKKIEGYEFAEQLSPEDREQIAMTIGKMAHSMKRTVQVSQFMNKEMVSILFEAEKLPEEILTQAREVESKMKLNPPVESRKKRLETKNLEEENNNVYGKLAGQDIYFGDELKAIETLPLHAKEKLKISGND